MISERRLFERMVDPDPTASRRRDLDIRALTESVLLHLRKLMNSRHGCTLIQADYGIPDLNEFIYAFPEAVGPMRNAIQQTIERYEPRLKSVRVRFVENPDKPLDIHFDVSARLAIDDETTPVSFSTRLGSAAGLEVAE
jgi:type VI secretion system protein